MYAIVLFENEGCYEGVPHSWIVKFGDKNLCYWPGGHKAGTLIRKCAPPSTSWKLTECRIKDLAVDYKEMVSKRDIAQNITTDNAASSSGDDDVMESSSKLDVVNEISSEEILTLAAPPPPPSLQQKKRKDKSKCKSQDLCNIF